MNAGSQKAVLVTITGTDQPGIVSELTSALAKSEVIIQEMGQAVIHGRLTLSILFSIKDGNDTHSPIKDLLFRAAELNLKLEFQVLTDSRPKSTPKRHRYALTLLTKSLAAKDLHNVTSLLAKHEATIAVIKPLSENSEFTCFEFVLASDQDLESGTFKNELMTLAQDSPHLDVSFQKEGLLRRSKRMVAFDMDSTLIQSEVIDEFAKELGVMDRVSAITKKAMEGTMDFDEALKLRCMELKGLTCKQMDRVFSRIKLTPGAEELICVLKKLGYKIAVISGGFSVIANRIKDQLGIDYAHANELVFKDGVCTGEVKNPIMNAQRKADVLQVMAQQEKISLDQVIAIGDGANDIPMLRTAGLGVAFNAKALVQKKAHTSINQDSLVAILYLLGISRAEAKELFDGEV